MQSHEVNYDKQSSNRAISLLKSMEETSFIVGKCILFQNSFKPKADSIPVKYYLVSLCHYKIYMFVPHFLQFIFFIFNHLCTRNFRAEMYQ